MKRKILPIIIAITIPILLGGIGGWLGNISTAFDTLTKPILTPPAIVFPIVWTILYLLMGISSYLVYQSDAKEKKNALILYAIQLLLNVTWTFVFFHLKWYVLGTLWILILLLIVAIMSYQFHKINKTAGLLQIPYIIWLIFALFLSYQMTLLNV